MGLDPKSIHLIGHSLGSHIAGFTGKQFMELTARKVGRISGLDPAGPCFSLVAPELRLQAGDAHFVDVIHTDGGVFGLTDQIGKSCKIILILETSNMTCFHIIKAT